MVREKRAKTKIKRRSAGLVITPPVPRPVASDHPARLLFRDAIESAKASSDTNLTETRSEAESRDNDSPALLVEAEVKSTSESARTEPLQIFKELKDQTKA